MDLRTAKRIKIISNSYVALKTLCWRYEEEYPCYKLMMEIVRKNDHSSFLQIYSQWTFFYHKVRKEFEETLSFLLEKVFFGSLEKYPDEKLFSKWAEKLKLRAVLFYMRNKKVENIQQLKKFFKRTNQTQFWIFYKSILKIKKNMLN